jgi:hypothetical protein
VQAHELIRVMEEERGENRRMQEVSDPGNYLFYFKQLLTRHDSQQEGNIAVLQEV